MGDEKTPEIFIIGGRDTLYNSCLENEDDKSKIVIDSLINSSNGAQNE